MEAKKEERCKHHTVSGTVPKTSVLVMSSNHHSLAIAEVEVVYIDMYISYIQKSGGLWGGGKLWSYVSASRLCRVGGGG